MKFQRSVLLPLGLCAALIGCAKRQTVAEEPPPASSPPPQAAEVQELLRQADEAIAKAVAAGAEKSAPDEMHSAKEYRSFCSTSTQAGDFASARFQCNQAVFLARQAESKAAQTKSAQKKKPAAPAPKPGAKKK